MDVSCWVVSDGRAGIEAQCLGLAEAMGLAPVIKQVRLRAPWRQLSPVLLRLGNAHAYGPGSDPIAPPWPELLIGCGRQSVAASLAVAAVSPATLRVQIQDPKIPTGRFDLVIVPNHDRLRGPQVLVTRGSLHRVTAARLAAAVARFAPDYAALPRPLVVVLVGGSGGGYRLGTDEIDAIVAQLRALAAAGTGVGLAATASRRTGEAATARLRAGLRGVAAVWDGTGENPYFGLLGLADAFLVTADSVNMVCEAASTGKPVQVIGLPGGRAKFRRFHQGMMQEGHTRAFTGRLEQWRPPELDDTAMAAAKVWELLRSR
jgi:mitochondrial fission protein ELM1